MSNLVGRGLGQPGEGALVAGGLTVGNGVDSLVADCQATGTATCELDPGSVLVLPGGTRGQTPRLQVIDLEPQLLRAEAMCQVELERTADMQPDLLLGVGAAGAHVDVVVELDAVVAASAQASVSPQRVQDEAELLALLL